MARRPIGPEIFSKDTAPSYRWARSGRRVCCGVLKFSDDHTSLAYGDVPGIEQCCLSLHCPIFPFFIRWHSNRSALQVFARCCHVFPPPRVIRSLVPFVTAWTTAEQKIVIRGSKK